jgi:hypothetical protein
MKSCEVCGNEYDKAFDVIVRGQSHTFDCFECAAHALAPSCAYCKVMILGHGVESSGKIFCCAHCARSAGESSLKDRAA